MVKAMKPGTRGTYLRTTSWEWVEASGREEPGMDGLRRLDRFSGSSHSFLRPSSSSRSCTSGRHLEDSSMLTRPVSAWDRLR